MKKFDFIDLLIVGVMITCVLFSLQYYFYLQNSKCVASPLQYAVAHYEKEYGEKFFGQLTMIREGGNTFRIIFDATNISIDYIPDR